MDPSNHSSNFNSAQMATDQRERPGALSGQTVPSSSVGSYQANLTPHHNPCNIDDWSRWVSQPLLVPSSPHSRFYPQMDAEYSMGLSHQNLGASNYTWINHHDIPPHVPGIDSPNMGPMGEIKDEYVDEDKSEWKTIRQSPIKEELYYSGMLPMQNLPPSPPSTSTDSSYPSPESGHAPSPERTGSGMNNGDAKERAGNLPYSILIYRALKSADGNKLSLQGIYRWFEMNTDKAKDPNHKGWQNSIRHNLSMNAVGHRPLAPLSYCLDFADYKHHVSHILMFYLGIRGRERRNGTRPKNS